MTKSPKKSPATRRKSSASQASAQKPTSGFTVQVIYRASQPLRGNAPKEDNLWIGHYPIIPRVGDNICHSGIYYRVDHVYLYESTTPSWCADLIVSYVGHQYKNY